MAVYTQLEFENIQGITAAYGFEARSFTTIEGGSSNTNCLVESAGERYILTLFESFSAEQAERIARLLELIERHGIPTNRLLRLPDGRPIGDFRGKPVMIKIYIAGEVRPADGSILREAGAALAKLHSIPVPDFLPDRHIIERESIPAVLANSADSRDEAGADFPAVLARSLAELKADLRRDLPRGLIHGDLFFDNMLVAGGRLQAILDFEEACVESFALDLGMAILGLCTNDRTPELDRARDFMDGYRGLRELTDAEKNSLQSFCEYAALGTAAWRYWKFRIETPMDAKKDRYRQMADCARAYREIPPDEFSRALFD